MIVPTNDELISARLVGSGRLVRFKTNGETIGEMEPFEDSGTQPYPWITPGLFDLQVNGALGISFNDPTITVEGIRRVVDRVLNHGMTGILATLITASNDDIVGALEKIESARSADPVVRKVIAGYHIEGPAISPVEGYRGAHPARWVRVPTAQEYKTWQESAHGLIKLITVAPEIPGALAWIELLVNNGVTVALGHTGSDASSIQAAVALGARLSTHLGNGCASNIDRHANPIWPQLVDNKLLASVIADGHHIPEAFLRAVLRCKRPGNLVLTCDSSALAGCPPALYHMWERPIEVMSDGRVTIPGTQYLAGSGHFLDHCLRHAWMLDEWTPQDILHAATDAPRRLLGLPCIGLRLGDPADLVLWSGNALSEAKPTAVCLAGCWKTAVS